MAYFSLSIDQITNDLHLDAAGDLATVTDAEAVGQHARARLLTFSGEWYLDTEAGVSWLSDVLGQSSKNTEIADAIVKAELLDTQGVADITTFSTSYDRATRGVNIRSISVTTEFDEEVQI